MNKTLKRILVTTLLIVMLNNFIFSNISFVYAEDDEADMKRVMGPIVSSVVGLLTLPIRLIAVFIGNAINRVTALVAYSQYPEDGTNDSDGKASTINPFDILFNKVQLVDINFFHIDNSKTIVNTIRKGVASWYYVMRLIATAILLVILVYVGIRMALSTVASEKATYKKMLFDWAMSLAIIYVLHYLIIFVLYLNDAIVSTLEAAAATDTGEVSAIIDALFVLSKKWMNINSIPATAVYCLLGWQTIGLLISYFNRMLKLAFLLIIAPLITITYSIDKMGDGKAQVLNRWLKEFIYTILIQPFHCIIYITLVSTSFKLMTSVATYTNGKANIPNAKNSENNLCIAGHNYGNDNFFSNIYKLEKKDLIKIKDLYNNTFNYSVYKTFEIDESDIQTIIYPSSDITELTLLTCNNYNNKRIIVKAKLIKK